jgi:gas vesicle protein
MRDTTGNWFTRPGLWTALAGGAVGFALGVLFAPQKGRKARRRMAYQMEYLTEQLAAWMEELLGTEIDSEARRTGDALVADAQARADHIRDDIESLLKELREQEASSRSSAS